MDEHYHDVRQVNGAAEHHDLDMLTRDVRQTAATVAVLERQNNRQHAEIERLKSRTEVLEDIVHQAQENHNELQRQIIALAEQVRLLARAFNERSE